jgi:hypothetical protein
MQGRSRDRGWSEYHAYLITPIPLPGDYNHNGAVDAADYVVWRKTEGTPAGYNAWRTHFGQPSGSGTAAVSPSSAVPEPAALLLITMGCFAAALVRDNRRNAE